MFVILLFQVLFITWTLAVPNYAPKVEVDESVCKRSELLGTPHGGGWWICVDEASIRWSACIVYSYGLGADWSFDNELEKRGCHVHGFDPSGKLWQEGMHGRDYQSLDYGRQYPSPGKTFHAWGLGAASRASYPAGSIPQLWPGLGDPALSKTNSETWEMRSFVQTFVDLGHVRPRPPYQVVRFLQLGLNTTNMNVKKRPKIRDDGRYVESLSVQSFEESFTTISVLKIDVEGAEWDALAALLSHPPLVALLKKGFIRQLLVEYHWDPDSSLRNPRQMAIMSRVRELGFIPWKVERHVGSDCCLDMSYLWVSK